MKKFLILATVILIMAQAVVNITRGNNAAVNEKTTIQTIDSGSLRVSIDPRFPRIVQYTWISTAEVMYAQEDQLTQVIINGKLYNPKITFTKLKNRADYILDVPEISVSLKISIAVNQNIVDFKVIEVSENGSFKVSTLEIPDHNLLSVRNTQPGASFAGAKMYTAVQGSGDVFIPLSDKLATDSIPKDFLYGIVNTGQLAASLWTNSVTEKSDNSRIQKQTIRKNGYLRTGLWSGSWIYRAKGMTSTDALPAVKIVITKDNNNDKLVDWQDGAITFRSIMNNPMGSDRIPDLVVQRIPMNFASQATNPFSKTLDETKRIYLNTDGLGQFVILKGYGSEGHDSAHPDYGEIGKRQGGAKDMEMLCKAAQKYNAFIGVHINGTESYAEAKAFDDSLVNRTKPGWDWLDASYYINKRYDATSNKRMVRLQSLKDQVPSFNFIYCDVWYAKGSWDSKKLGREIHSLGLTLGTEFPNDHESDAVWNHWAVDYNYGGKDIKGFNSQIVRFIRNHQKDTWVGRHPLLGGEEMKDFEGCQGRNNIDSCIVMTFLTDLPTKYLQHFPIIKWEENSINFEKNVVVTTASGRRIITKDGRIVLDGDKYLLPWSPISEEKLYHWNSNAGSTTWTLPSSWNNNKTVILYQLTDQGKKLIRNIDIVNNQITIQALANTPYVIYKKRAEPQKETNWGEGALVRDPGFNNGDLKFWKVNGSAASVTRNNRGQYEMNIGKGEATTVSQTLTGLIGGSYYASVYVSSPGNRKANLEIDNYGGPTVTAYCNSSLWKNYISADSKSDTTMQRMYVFFTIPEGQTTGELTLEAEAGLSKVTFDDVRVASIKYTAKPDSILFSQDFENVPDGLYPFVKGPSGGINDPRTHLSEMHTPYTQKGWNGKKIDDVISGNWSLKAHGEPKGLLLQTIPQTIRFISGKTYAVSFKYEASGSDYALVIGDGITKKLSLTLNPSDIPNTTTFTFIAGESGNSWFGIEKLNDKETDLVMDDIIITEK